MEIEEEPSQLIVAELFHRYKFYPLPGKQAIMKLTGLIRGKRVSSAQTFLGHSYFFKYCWEGKL